MKTRASIADLETNHGKATTNKSKAEELNNFFTSVFTKEDVDNVPQLEDKEEVRPMQDLIVSEEIVLTKLQKLNPCKSQGPDEIHPRVLKELCSELAKPLAIVYQKSLDEGILPQLWKDAHITPIFKKGDRSKSTNYRPVSLTCVVCKVLESIIRDHVTKHVETNNLLSECQHGFTPGRSCSTQLLSCLEIWTEFLDRDMCVDTIYLDFAKAFDSVPHERLLCKLKSYGINEKVIDWSRNFLQGRRQKVLVNGESSGWRDVVSGVPQGSVLGPTYFILYVNDMPEVVHNHIRLFADDAKIFCGLARNGGSESLQTDLDNLLEWSRKWQLSFNASKCRVMHMGTKNSKQSYKMGETTLEDATEEKDLGVIVDDQLKFDQHFELIVNKANRTLGLMRRSFVNIDKEMFSMLYKSLVRTNLEYCNAVAFPQSVKQARMLESVQRRATKLVSEVRSLEYCDRLRKLSLPSLCYRRDRGDMIEVYKYTHGLYKTEELLVLDNTQKGTRGHPYKLAKQHCSKSLRQKFFSMRVVNKWNNLPKSVVEAVNTNQFKNRLDSHWKEKQYSLNFEI